MLNYECKVENKGSIHRELTISVKPDSIQKYIDAELVTLQKTAKIKGFRQGKVPVQILKQQFMKDVKSEVFSRVIRESYLKALEENKLSAVGSPQIETQSGAGMNEGESLTYKAKIEVFPEIEIKDLSKIKLTRKSSELKDADIEKSLQNLRESHAEVVPNEDYQGPAKLGDLAMISFNGTVNGEALDSLKADNRLISLGEKQFMEDFENNVIGMKKGETKTFNVPFPADFQEPKLAGNTVIFNVTLHEFKKKELPALDDDFAKRFKMETSLELRKKVAESLQEDRSKQARDELKEDLLKALNEQHKFDVPQGLVASQLEHLLKDNAEYLTRQGFTEKMVRDYLEKNKDELMKRAEEQVRVALILDRIAAKESIKVEAKDLDHEYAQLSARMGIPAEQIRGIYEKDEQALRQLRFRLREERTVEWVLSQAKVTEAK